MPPPPPPASQQQQPPPPASSTQPSAFLSTVLNNPSTATTSSTPPRPPRASAYEAPRAPPPFSATQRSLQARNKEYNVLGRKEESYEVRQRREEASRILESTEMLIWWSAARNESMPQTRQHFQNIVLGIEEFDEDVAWREEWEVEERMMGTVGSSPRSAKGKEREKERGKRRVSSGLHA